MGHVGCRGTIGIARWEGATLGKVLADGRPLLMDCTHCEAIIVKAGPAVAIITVR